MEYKGKLYAKIANKYLEISHTDEFEKLEKEVDLQQENLMLNEVELIPLRESFKRLQDNIVVYQTEIQEKNDLIKDLAHRVNKLNNLLNG